MMRLEVDEGVAVLSYALYEPAGEGIRQIFEGALAAMVQVLRDLCGTAWVPSEVLIPRRAPANTEAYRKCFCAPVRFDQEMAALVFPARWLNARLPSADSAARRLLEERVLQLEQTCPSDIVDDLRRMLRTELLKKRCSATQAARSFSMHNRTFSRRLKVAGTGFRTVADKMRFEIARQLLADTNMPLGEISAALDFSEAAAFTRAFERWSGEAPSVWRSSHNWEGAQRFGSNTPQPTS